MLDSFSRFAEEGEDDLDLFWGEDFAGAGVAGGLEGGHKGFVGMDFVGEAFACTLLAVVGEIGHSQILFELIYCHTLFLLRLNNLFTTPFESRDKNIRKVKSGVWHCPLSILIMFPIYTDTILLGRLGKSVFYGCKEADLRKIGNKNSEAPPC